MEATKLQFLTAVLGESGASALVKASERSELLEHALVPRTILAWIGAAPVFEGHVPGVDGVYVSFQKSESGFSGSVTVDDGLYKFENQSLFHVAATVAVAMGIEEDHVHPDLRAVDIERLGKSIDLLAKMRRANEELARGKPCKVCGKKIESIATRGEICGPCKTRPPAAGPKDGVKKDELEKKSPPGKFKDLPEKLKDKGYSADSAFAIAWSQKNKADAKKGEDPPNYPHEEGDEDHCVEASHGCGPDADGYCKECGQKMDVEKGESGTGAAAAPQAPKAPEAPVASAPQTPKTSKPMSPKGSKPASNTLRLSEPETSRRCQACGIPQFDGEVFAGCMCFSSLCLDARLVKRENGFVTVRLGDSWDVDSVLTFLEAIGR